LSIAASGIRSPGVNELHHHHITPALQGVGSSAPWLRSLYSVQTPSRFESCGGHHLCVQRFCDGEWLTRWFAMVRVLTSTHDDNNETKRHDNDHDMTTVNFTLSDHDDIHLCKNTRRKRISWRTHLHAQPQQHKAVHEIRVTTSPNGLCSSLFSIQHNPSTTACGCQHLGGQLFRALIGRSTLHRLDVCGGLLGARERSLLSTGYRLQNGDRVGKDNYTDQRA
jgi:hypothetical protein